MIQRRKSVEREKALVACSKPESLLERGRATSGSQENLLENWSAAAGGQVAIQEVLTKTSCDAQTL